MFVSSLWLNMPIQLYQAYYYIVALDGVYLLWFKPHCYTLPVCVCVGFPQVVNMVTGAATVNS